MTVSNMHKSLIALTHRPNPVYSTALLGRYGTETRLFDLYTWIQSHGQCFFFNFILTEEKTGGLIGIPETLLASASVGCLFALFSCQPLVIVGKAEKNDNH